MAEYESDSRKGDPESGIARKPGTKYFIGRLSADQRLAPKFKGRVLSPNVGRNKRERRA